MSSRKKSDEKDILPVDNLDLRETSDGVVLQIKVQPRASRNQFVGAHEGHLRIRCTSPPEDGKANQQCIELLAEKLGIPPSSVAIIRGRPSRFKTVLLRGLTPREVNERLRSTG
jgi:uncharacterized protein (TIGR00251 family)